MRSIKETEAQWESNLKIACRILYFYALISGVSACCLGLYFKSFMLFLGILSAYAALFAILLFTFSIFFLILEDLVNELVEDLKEKQE